MVSQTATKSNSQSTHAEEELKQAAIATREGVKDMGSAAKDVAAERVDALTSEVEALKLKLEAKIEEKPLNAALLAAGGGLLLGLLLRRN